MTTTIERPVGLLSHLDEFESIYVNAGGDRALIPWDRGGASSALINWLNAVAPSIVRCGARVIVPGCGLGEDARALRQRGYDVTAFDCSPTAIQWAQRLDSRNADFYHVADLFDPPARWRHRFDLVVEINTIQSLPPETRADTMSALRELMSPHGRMLVICRGLDDDASDPADGPPWPLRERELIDAAGTAGLTVDGATSSFIDDTVDPPARRLRALLRRG